MTLEEEEWLSQTIWRSIIPNTTAETSMSLGLKQFLCMWMDEDAALWCILELLEQLCE